MQLLMRRPEIDGFICVAPPSNLYDFSFLAPCPSSGLMINGDKDRVVPTAAVAELSAKLKTQKGIKITHEVIPGANHFFENKSDELDQIVGSYVDERMVQFEKDRARRKSASGSANASGLVSGNWSGWKPPARRPPVPTTPTTSETAKRWRARGAATSRPTKMRFSTSTL